MVADDSMNAHVGWDGRTEGRTSVRPSGRTSVSEGGASRPLRVAARGDRAPLRGRDRALPELAPAEKPCDPTGDGQSYVVGLLLEVASCPGGESALSREVREHLRGASFFYRSPHRGDLGRSLVVTRHAAREVVLVGDPVCASHLWLPQFLNDEFDEEREAGLHPAVAWLPLCDEILVVGDRTTDGMRHELPGALAIGLGVRRFP